jgi:hypothetical protein
MTRQSAMNCSATRQRIKVWLISGLGLATMFHRPSTSTTATAPSASGMMT